MLYSCSLEWVDVSRPLGVHMGPILQELQWIKCFGVPGGSQHNGGYKYISLPWWQFWGLGTPKWAQNLVSKHSELSRMVRGPFWARNMSHYFIYPLFIQECPIEIQDLFFQGVLAKTRHTKSFNIEGQHIVHMAHKQSSDNGTELCSERGESVTMLSEAVTSFL